MRYNRYRGAAPIQHALINGETETGISIIDVHPTKFDGGRVLLQQRLVRIVLSLIVIDFCVWLLSL